MSLLRIVLDTNCLLQSISRRSSNAIVIDKLLEGKYDLYLTNEIQLEYEEKMTEIFSIETAELILGALALTENVHKIDVHFQLNLISADADDNKFVDCAFAGNVHYLVSNDKHYDILKSIRFPIITVVNLDTFKTILQKR
ncbi:MAG: putative toxin-antitoxin system toxin component, PIN family [Chitinophagia bacterium]|nr:putative toxin-antitoxin system toxin component, PIN family [Chitinophagia bacterium]